MHICEAFSELSKSVISVAKSATKIGLLGAGLVKPVETVSRVVFRA